MAQKLERGARIKAHIRNKITGTAERPRLTVFRSNAQIYAQVIIDEDKLTGKKIGKTVASASSLKISEKATKKEIAEKVGEAIASAAKAAGVEEVVFDRNGYLYHGRVKELAEGARKGGLKF